MSEEKVKHRKVPFTDPRPVHERLLIGNEEFPYGGIYQLQVMTPEQACRLYHTAGSLTRVYDLLHELKEHHYVQAGWLQGKPPERKGQKLFYTLDQASIPLLKDKDMDISPYFRASRQMPKSGSHIPHLIGLNDVLISAMLLHRVAPLCSLTTLVHERELKRHPCTFMWRGRRMSVVPDAFLTIQVILSDGRTVDVAVLIEHDNDSEFGERFRNKLRVIHAMLQAEAYKERFGVDYITVAFTTFKGPQRRDRMREVTCEVLGNNVQTYGQLFLFTSQPQPPDSKHLWLSPCWYTVHDEPPIALLGDIQ